MVGSPTFGREVKTNLTPLLTTWGDRGPSLVAVIYYHATYLFLYNFSYVAIMSFYDSAPITDFFGGV